MSTPWNDIHAIFFDLIEEDGGFFSYYNANDEESLALARQRAESMLREAALYAALECDGTVDFSAFSKNEHGEMEFAADLTEIEKSLLANLQYEMYLRRDLAKLRAFSHSFTPTDLQVFSPANDRKSFVAMYERVCEENRQKLDRYKSKDRFSHSAKTIDYAAYDE